MAHTISRAVASVEASARARVGEACQLPSLAAPPVGERLRISGVHWWSMCRWRYRSCPARRRRCATPRRASILHQRITGCRLMEPSSRTGGEAQCSHVEVPPEILRDVVSAAPVERQDLPGGGRRVEVVGLGAQPRGEMRTHRRPVRPGGGGLTGNPAVRSLPSPPRRGEGQSPCPVRLSDVSRR